MILGISSISPVHQILFGYKHPLKTLWKAGQFPTVIHGLYGEELTKDTISLEHIVPASFGGPLRYENLALASIKKNTSRGRKDLRKFLTPEMAQNYLNQFKGIKIDHIFYGNTYIKGIKATLRKLGILIKL